MEKEVNFFELLTLETLSTGSIYGHSNYFTLVYDPDGQLFHLSSEDKSIYFPQNWYFFEHLFNAFTKGQDYQFICETNDEYHFYSIIGQWLGEKFDGPFTFMCNGGDLYFKVSQIQSSMAA